MYGKKYLHENILESRTIKSSPTIQSYSVKRYKYGMSETCKTLFTYVRSCIFHVYESFVAYINIVSKGVLVIDKFEFF